MTGLTVAEAAIIILSEARGEMDEYEIAAEIERRTSGRNPSMILRKPLNPTFPHDTVCSCLTSYLKHTSEPVIKRLWNRRWIHMQNYEFLKLEKRASEESSQSSKRLCTDRSGSSPIPADKHEPTPEPVKRPTKSSTPPALPRFSFKSTVPTLVARSAKASVLLPATSAATKGPPPAKSELSKSPEAALTALLGKAISAASAALAATSKLRSATKYGDGPLQLRRIVCVQLSMAERLIEESERVTAEKRLHALTLAVRSAAEALKSLLELGLKIESAVAAQPSLDLARLIKRQESYVGMVGRCIDLCKKAESVQDVIGTLTVVTSSATTIFQEILPIFTQLMDRIVPKLPTEAVTAHSWAAIKSPREVTHAIDHAETAVTLAEIPVEPAAQSPLALVQSEAAPTKIPVEPATMQSPLALVQSEAAPTEISVEPTPGQSPLDQEQREAAPTEIPVEPTPGQSPLDQEQREAAPTEIPVEPTAQLPVDQNAADDRLTLPSALDQSVQDDRPEPVQKEDLMDHQPEGEAALTPESSGLDQRNPQEQAPTDLAPELAPNSALDLSELANASVPPSNDAMALDQPPSNDPMALDQQELEPARDAQMALDQQELEPARDAQKALDQQELEPARDAQIALDQQEIEEARDAPNDPKSALDQLKQLDLDREAHERQLAAEALEFEKRMIKLEKSGIDFIQTRRQEFEQVLAGDLQSRRVNFDQQLLADQQKLRQEFERQLLAEEQKKRAEFEQELVSQEQKQRSEFDQQLAGHQQMIRSAFEREVTANHVEQAKRRLEFDKRTFAAMQSLSNN